MGEVKRWIFLFFTSTALFGSQFITDQVAILATRLSGTSPQCYQNDGTDYTCLSMSATEFNALYVCHFWAGAVCALCAGFLTARFGVWIMSLATAGALFLGMLLFTLGPYCKTTETAFGLMMVGKLIFGCGYWGNIVVSQQVKSHWFYGKELAVSFAVYTNSVRASAIISYASVGTIVEKYGLQQTMWIIFGAALLAPISAVIAGWVYRQYAESSMETSVYRHSLIYSNGVDLSVAKRLDRYFWTVGFYIFTFYGAFIMVLADFPKFLAEARGQSEAVAGLISGIVVDVGILSPVLAILTDVYGWREVQMFVAAVLFFIAALGQTVIPSFHPILFTVLVGTSYSIFTACVWSAVVVVTTPSTVGIAMGLATSFQAFSAGFFLLIVGLILDASMNMRSRWTGYFALLTGAVTVALILSSVVWYLDWKTFLRPLRSKHSTSIPAAAAEMNEDVAECLPITKDENVSSSFFKSVDSRHSLQLPILV